MHKDQQGQPAVLSRRRFLRRAGTVAAAATVLPGLAARARAASTPIRHVIVACQENRSFDHYFGYYPRAGAFGVPAGFSQPNGQGGTVRPYHLWSTITGDISHSWSDIHKEWDGGRMDGFYTTDGSTAIGYYDSQDLGYYYSLANTFTLCGNYFCSVLGPTNPSRLYLFSGTSAAARPITWRTVA